MYYNIKKIILLLFIIILLINSNVFAKANKSKKTQSNQTKEESKIISIDNIKLIKVIDGDTLEVLLNNKETKIRLLGIQAPELFSNPIEPFAQITKEYLEKLLESSPTIRIEYVSSNKTDKYNRILADVYTFDGIWVNGFLIDKSLAFVYILNNSTIPHIEKLLSLENNAIEKQPPLWRDDYFSIIKPNRAYQFINKYKVIDGTVLNILNTKHSIWLQMEKNGQDGFSLRISKDNIKLFGSMDNINQLLNKSVRIRGFIDKYSDDYGPFIDIKSKYAIEILNK